MIKKFIKNYLYSKVNFKFFVKNYTDLKDLKTISYAMKSMRHRLIIEPYENKRLLKGNTIIFAPHPDDEIIGAGGTILKLIKDITKIHCIYFSSTNETSKELKKVTNSLKFSTTELGLTANNFTINDEILNVISDQINLYKPKRIFLPFIFDDHDDHRRVSQIFMELFNKKKIYKKNFEIWCYQIYTFFPTNVYVDITKHIKKKIYYLKKYKSQVRRKNFVQLVLSMNGYNSRFINVNKETYLENFFTLPSNEYVNLCKKYFKTPKNCYYNKKYF